MKSGNLGKKGIQKCSAILYKNTLPSSITASIFKKNLHNFYDTSWQTKLFDSEM
jgi:hypothetical protein